MILEFTIKNIFSFKEETSFSMLANSSTELCENYMIVGGKKILKTAVVYGANASGKSNLFSALNMVCYLLKNSINLDVNDEIPVIPYELDVDSKKNPCEFEMSFIVDNIKYIYGFKATTKSVIEEYLYYYPNGRQAKIFDRSNIDDYVFAIDDKKFLNDLANKTTSNKFFLATATNWNYGKTKPAYDFLTKMGVYFDFDHLRYNAFESYYENDKLKDFAISFLQTADFNIEDFIVSQSELPKELLEKFPEQFRKQLMESPITYQTQFIHKNSKIQMPFNKESIGTQMVFLMIPFLFDALNNNNVLIIDEIDKSLHPFLVQYIVKMFNDPKINKNGTQLIFNTHDTNLLDLKIFRRDQIWFTEKNYENGESILYSLSDFPVRKGENVKKGYVLGRYGAIPFINGELDLWDKGE